MLPSLAPLAISSINTGTNTDAQLSMANRGCCFHSCLSAQLLAGALSHVCSVLAGMLLPPLEALLPTLPTHHCLFQQEGLAQLVSRSVGPKLPMTLLASDASYRALWTHAVAYHAARATPSVNIPPTSCSCELSVRAKLSCLLHRLLMHMRLLMQASCCSA